VTGTDKLINALEAMELSFKDFRPLFNQASQEFYAIEKELFATEGRSGASGKWAPLTRSYARWKTVHRPGKPILQSSGTLMRSLMQPNARFSMRRITEEEMSIGTSDPKAVFHFNGTRRMPARPPVALTPPQAQRIVKVLRDGLVDVAKRAKFLVVEVG
jgi:phage gpG-like protein